MATRQKLYTFAVLGGCLDIVQFAERRPDFLEEFSIYSSLYPYP